MGTLSSLLALHAEKPPITGRLPPQRASNGDLWCFFVYGQSKLLNNSRYIGYLKGHDAHVTALLMDNNLWKLIVIHSVSDYIIYIHWIVGQYYMLATQNSLFQLHLNISAIDTTVMRYRFQHNILQPWSQIKCWLIGNNQHTVITPNTETQRTHDAIITVLLRQNDVATSFWRNNDIIIASCVR